MNGRVLCAALLAAGFAWVTVVAVAIEPGMGFHSLGDFLDPSLVSAGFETTAWKVEGVLYLLFPVAFWCLAMGQDDRLLVHAGVAAAVFFLMVGSIDRVLAQLPSLVSGEADARSAFAALLPMRLALLRCAVVAIGVLAWRSTATGWGSGALDRAWRGLGYVLLAASGAFLYVLLPIPLLITVWAAALTLREATRAPEAA